MNETFLKQLLAELIDAQTDAITILAQSMGDVTDRPALHQALQRRLTTAQGAAAHPMRDQLLQRALQALAAAK